MSTRDHDPSPASTKPPSKALGMLGFVTVALLGVGGLFAYQALSDEPAPQRAASLGAKLELAAGQVVLVREGDGEAAAEQPLLSGTPLPLGAKLRTGAGARALVRLPDGSRVFMHEHSAITVGEGTGITVDAGQVWLETQPLDPEREPLLHTVGPATLSLSDGGASLTLAPDGSASLYVAEGVAWVRSDGGPKEVKTGEQALVTAGAAPQVEPLAFWDDWTGGMADRKAGARIHGGSGSLYAVDRAAPPGTPALPLAIASQRVDVAIDPGGLAETRVDQRFFNGSERDVEGWYWFTIPEGATLVGFELETDGRLVAGEIVEKQQAVASYEAAIVSDDNPALLEWVDERTVRARIYPVPALGERRIVVRYQQLLREADGKLRYSYPLAGAGGREAPTLEELSLAVELRGDLGQRYTVSTLDEATVAEDDALITMRRTGYTPRADFELELTRKPNPDADAPAAHASVRLNQLAGRDGQANYVMLRWIPELDFASVPAPRADVVVVVDTSAFGDDAEYLARIAVAEALLRSLSSDDRFAVMAADLGAELLYPAQDLSAATPEAISAALDRLRAHRPGGATDLGAIFERALSRVHEAEQPAIVYIGDGLATSGERSTDALGEHLRRTLTGSRARLFTVGVGATVDERLLGRLARIGGGEALRVEGPEQAVVRALELSGALKTPTITELELELGGGPDGGLDDRFDNATGKLARGQELVVLARSHRELPETATIRGRVGGEAFEQIVPIERTPGAVDTIVPKLWAAARVERLLGDGRGPEAVRGQVLALGLEYGLMTPFTSFLALDSEQAYARQGIERRKRAWDLKLLGSASLPSSREVEAQHGRRDDLRPSAGELLLAAATAPLGCAQAPSDQARNGREEAARAKSEPASAAAARAEQAGGQGQRQRDEAAPERAAEAPTDAPASAPALRAEPQEEAKFDAPPPAPPASASTGSVAPGGGGFADGNAAPAPEPEPSYAPARKASASPGPAADKDRRALTGDGDPLAGLEGSLADDLVDAEVVAQLGGGLAKSTELGSVGSSARPRKPKPTSPVARQQKLACSDASARPLAQRKLLWEQRLTRSPDMIARLRAYENAAASCELENWRQQQVYLQLLQASATTEAEIELLLAHFGDEPEAQGYLAKALLRRLIEPALVGAVERSLDDGRVDVEAIAAAVDRAPTTEEGLALLDEALAKHGLGLGADDQRLPLLLLRLDLLAELGRVDEAIAAARKLRERGLITPLLAQRLGALLVRAGRVDEAKRVYSEIVEYDPRGAATRRLLGDIFLRHGWHQEAYRQYEDLVATTQAPTDWIRLARAAAGAGRVDEGLRLLRKVAAGDGRPGPDDPRRFARLHAAALLAELLTSDEALPRDALERELERLALFDGPGTITLLRWADLQQHLTLGVELPTAEGEPTPEQLAALQRAALQVSEGRPAADTGLWSIPAGDLDALVVRHRGEVPRHAVAYERIVLTWDGQRFAVERDTGELR